MRESFIIILVAFATCFGTGLSEDNISEKIPEKRLISTFQIVRFPNDACIGTNTRNGTCYTSAECSDKGGSSSGSCADGFGVCCTFVIAKCGSASSENITYWAQSVTADATIPSYCDLTITPLNDNICQLRLDFDIFVITGPSTTSVKEALFQLGQPTAYKGQAADTTDVSWKTNCLQDVWSINGASTANIPPTLCGTITGDHMYVDANNDGNKMLFTFSPLPGPAPLAATTSDTRGIGTLASPRQWDIKVTQYECGSIVAAPDGCTQYFTGVTTGVVKSYNYAGGTHLANSNQKICIRRERLNCYVCYARGATATDFQISGMSAVNAFGAPGQACGYQGESDQNGLGASAKQAGGFDCVIIPGAFVIAIAATANSGTYATNDVTPANIRANINAKYQVPSPPQISSGGAFGVGIAAGRLGSLLGTVGVNAGDTTLSSICTKHVPFTFQFKSDGHEGTGLGSEAFVKTNSGFKIDFAQITCTG